MSSGAERYFHLASGRYYRISSDRRSYVFEDGQRIPVPAPSAAQPAPESTVQPVSQNTTSSTQPRSIARPPGGVRRDTLSSSFRTLSLSTSPGNGGIQRGSPHPSSSVSHLSVPAPYRQWAGADQRTGVRSNWEFGPPQRVTEPNVQHDRSYNSKFIRGNDDVDPGEGSSAGATPGTDPRRHVRGYTQSSDPENDFAVGRVVELLFIPPPRADFSAVTGVTPRSAFREENDVSTRMRRFVVIGPGSRPRSFKALPIKTYNGQGVAAPSVIKSHHTIIYTGRKAPRPKSSERPQRLPNRRVENSLRQQSIRVKPYDRETALDSTSRLDFFDVHEFDFNHYSKLFGTVHKDSRALLIPQFNAIWAEIQLSSAHSTPLNAIAGSMQGVTAGPSTTAPPAGSNARGSTPASPSTAVGHVQARLQALRSVAQANGFTVPTMTVSQVNQFAENLDALRLWVEQVKVQWTRDKAAMQNQGDNGEGVRQEDDDEEDEEDEEEEEEEQEEEEEEDDAEEAEHDLERQGEDEAEKDEEEGGTDDDDDDDNDDSESEE